MSILFLGLQKSVAFMTRRVREGTILTGLLVSLVAVSCGEPAGTGVQVNDGGEVEFDVTITGAGGGCSVSDVIWTSVAVFRSDADNGKIVFGADTILDIQAQPPTDALITNADIVVFATPIWTVQHSNNPNADFFVDPGLVVDTADGIGFINTGDDGVAYFVADFFGIFPEGDTPLFLRFFPAKGGDDFEITYTVSCS